MRTFVGWAKRSVPITIRGLKMGTRCFAHPTTLSVHDEIIAEVDCVEDGEDEFGSLSHFKNIMLNLPEWANGLPVDAQGYKAKRYRK